MRRLPTTALAMLATILTSAVAVAQVRPATPARPNRAGQPAQANRDSQPPRIRRAGPAGPQNQMGPGGPASNLLRMREQLDLTDDQVTKLQALQSSPRPRLNEADILRARADLMDATKGDVNLEKARAALERMARVRTDEQIAQMKVRQDARNVLTVAQRTKFDAFASNMRDRRGGAVRGRDNQRIGQARRPQLQGQQFRGPQFQGQRPGQGAGQFGPGAGIRRGPNGPPNGGQGFGPGMGQGMGPGMGQGQGMRPGQGMGPGNGQGMGPGMRNRMIRPDTLPVPPVPPTPDSNR